MLGACQLKNLGFNIAGLYQKSSGDPITVLYEILLK
jgi:hypothetical protein